MFIRDLLQVDTDISQTVIGKKFDKYLRIKQSDKTLRNKMKKGFCMGFTKLAMYALYIELTQPRQINTQKNSSARDDWRWLRSALIRLSKWDESEESLNKKTTTAKKLRSDTERLISLIEYFQSPAKYESTTQMQIQNHLFSTNETRFIQEYTFAGILTPAAFSQQILLPHDNDKSQYARITTPIQELIKENRLVFISTIDHVAGILKHNNHFFYFNSNVKSGWTIYTEKQLDQLSLDLFSGYQENEKQLPLQIKVLSDAADKREKYTRQAQLLAAINLEKKWEDTDKDKAKILYLAAELGCRESLDYHLRRTTLPIDTFINTLSGVGRTPLWAATLEEHTDLVLDLLKAGANPNITTQKNDTPLYLAIIKKNMKIIQYLLAAPNILISKEEYDALHALSRANPQNQVLQHYKLMAQSIYMEVVIQEQINQLHRKSHKVRNNMLNKLTEVRQEGCNRKLEPIEQMILMLDRMLPILVEAHRDNQHSIWRTPVLIDRILELAEQFNLQYELPANRSHLKMVSH